MSYQKMNYDNSNESLNSMHKHKPSKSDNRTSAVNNRNSIILNMKVIGITGIAGSGKDTVADILQELNPKTTRYSFAAPVKEAASIVTGLDPFHFSSDNPDRNKVHPIWNLSPRDILKLLGTDCCRDIIHKDIWIIRAKVAHKSALHKYPHSDLFVITDVRFNNEAEWIKSIGGEIWKVSRQLSLIGNRGHATKHETEQGIESKYYDKTLLNNSSLDDLRLEIIKALK